MAYGSSQSFVPVVALPEVHMGSELQRNRKMGVLRPLFDLGSWYKLPPFRPSLIGSVVNIMIVGLF